MLCFSFSFLVFCISVLQCLCVCVILYASMCSYIYRSICISIYLYVFIYLEFSFVPSFFLSVSESHCLSVLYSVLLLFSVASVFFYLFSFCLSLCLVVRFFVVCFSACPFLLFFCLCLASLNCIFVCLLYFLSVIVRLCMLVQVCFFSAFWSLSLYVYIYLHTYILPSMSTYLFIHVVNHTINWNKSSVTQTAISNPQNRFSSGTIENFVEF